MDLPRVSFCAFSLTVCWLSANLLGNSESPADHIKTLDGFSCEQVYKVPEGQGSWVSLAVDPQGRLITSDQYGKLYRVTPASLNNGQTAVENIELEIGFAHGLLCAFDSLYVMAHRNNNNPAGLYRVRDTNDDDRYDSVELLREFKGGGEHGPHAVILSPDGESLYICGGNHTEIPDPESSRVPKVWQEDQVIQRLWDPGGHAVNKLAPGGWVCKTDPDGKHFELVSIGFRNQFDIAFNRFGDLFTYDADMEWDIGTPWYRPTRVCHVTSGSEFGWRSGTGKWPAYYQDSLPSVVDIGVGSPTGIAFGYGTSFPQKYQDALFIADWSYGVIYAVHMEADGSTYRAEFERFCAAPALPVADLVVNPLDESLYFVVGGRRVESGLYRITAKVRGEANNIASAELNAQSQLRRELEAMHQPGGSVDLEKIFEVLTSTDDRFLRFAARTALEHQPVSSWADRMTDVTQPDAVIELVTAIARTGTASDLKIAIDALQQLGWQDLVVDQQLRLLRAWGLLRVRLDPQGQVIDDAINNILQHHYPVNVGESKSVELLSLNRELAKLLAATAPTSYIENTLQLLQESPSQHESIHYALCLSQIRENWTADTHRAYYQWFVDASKMRGGNSLRGFLNNIRAQSIESLDPAEKSALGRLVSDPLPTVNPYADLEARPFVKKWSADEVVHAVEDQLGQADLENGRKLFSTAQCYACHRFQGDGGFVGPDLTPAGIRYSLKDLVKNIVEPDDAISDQYQATQFLLADGRMISGRVVNLVGGEYRVQTDMIDPAKLERVNVDDIEEMKPATISMMPSGLLDSMTAEDIRDLIGFLKSR